MKETLNQENEELKKKNAELEERLKKYTNGDNHKRYYEKHKEKYKELGSNYLQKLKEEKDQREIILRKENTKKCS